MYSLLASYASSDDEDNVVEEEKNVSAPPPKPSLFASSLPPPQASSSSLLSSLPPPKFLSAASLSPPAPTSRDLGGENGENDERGRKPTAKNLPSSAPLLKPPSSSSFSSLPPPKTSASSSFFSSLPPPKSSRQSNLPQPSNASLDQNPKKVVQFILPLNPSVLQNGNFDEDDDEEEGKEKKKSKDSSSAFSKALSSMLPAPKNSLCLASTAASAASRRSVVEANVPEADPEGIGQQQEMSGFEGYGGYYHGGCLGGSVETGAEGTAVNSGFTRTNGAAGWDPYCGGEVTHMGRIGGKRGRNEIPFGSCGGEAG